MRFLKMHGLGNDFVIVDCRGGRPRPGADLVRAIGDRHRGVGFDQMVALTDDREGADVRAHFFNADGSNAGACGNATRCIAHVLMQQTGGDATTIRTDRGLLQAWRAPGNRITVDMLEPELDWTAVPLAHAVDTAGVPIDASAPGLPAGIAGLGPAACASMGNPHAVFIVDQVADLAVDILGPALERHPMFPERANIGFLAPEGRTRARLRVWERGAGLTLACGSGACAAAVAGVRRGVLDRAVILELDGGEIAIEWRGADGHVLMTGPVRTVFDGALSAEFLAAAAVPNQAKALTGGAA